MDTTPDPKHIKLAFVSLVLAGLIGVIPLLLPHHSLPLTAFDSEWVAFGLGLSACFPLLSSRFWLQLRIPPVAIGLFALVAVIALQTLVVKHVYAAQALLPGIYISWAAVLVILSTWIREQLGLERAVRILAWIILIGGALQAIVGVMQYLDVYGALSAVVEAKQGPSVYGNINQRNHFATQITMASFALIYLHATGRLGRLIVAGSLVLFAFVLTMSSSRTVVLYIFAGLILAFFSFRAAKTPIHQRLLQGTGLLLVSFFVLQLSLLFFGDWPKHLLAAIGMDVRGLQPLTMMQRTTIEGIDLRLAEWHKAWLMFLDSPFWGVGIDNYGWQSFNYQALPEFSNLMVAVPFRHSHNLVFQVLAELGMAGFVILVLIVAAWLRPLLPSWQKFPYWFIFSLLGVLAIHSCVEFPLWYSFFLGVAAILLGLGSEASHRVQFTPLLGQFTAGVALLLSGVILVFTFLGYQNISNVNELVSATSPQRAAAMLNAAAKNPLLTPVAEALIVQHGTPDPKALDQQLAMVTRVMQYRPGSMDINRVVIYLTLTGRSVEASALLKKFQIVFPNDFRGFACSWKNAPNEAARRLWSEAQALTTDRINCATQSGVAEDAL